MSNLTMTPLKILTGQSEESLLKSGHPTQNLPAAGIWASAKCSAEFQSEKSF